MYLSGLLVAGYAGVTSLPWYFIFISASILGFGWMLARIPQIPNMLSESGIFGVPKLIFYQVMIYSILTAPVYFISSLFS
jgi:hypothetical protein